jgi:hypothetical protein
MTQKVNLLIDQGSNFNQEIALSDENDDPLIVTAANGAPIFLSKSQMRKSYQAINAISFVTTLSNGHLTLSLSANATANIVAGRYVYDTELSSNATGSNVVTRIIEGIVTVKPEATKL